ncbi:hypothetical protein AgCh_002467 [Apium graveolens]
MEVLGVPECTKPKKNYVVGFPNARVTDLLPKLAIRYRDFTRNEAVSSSSVSRQREAILDNVYLAIVRNMLTEIRANPNRFARQLSDEEITTFACTALEASDPSSDPSQRLQWNSLIGGEIVHIVGSLVEDIVQKTEARENNRRALENDKDYISEDEVSNDEDVDDISGDGGHEDEEGESSEVSLSYGVILEKFQQMDYTLKERIKGCIIDSAPVASPHPKVWASGFSTAFLKKQSAVTKEFKTEVPGRTKFPGETKPAFKEVALHVILERVFEVVLRLPVLHGRLTFLMDQMKSGQPRCPQLYIYSSADKVIPEEYVESFIAEQQRIGHQVRACNFISTPYVDHMRNHPELYKTQLTEFLEDYALTCCKHDPGH